MKNLTIASTTRRTGIETDAIITKATYGDIRITATYDVLTGNLLIDKWYLFDEAELAELRKALNDHFAKAVA